MPYTKESLSSNSTDRGSDNKLQTLESVSKFIRQVRDRAPAMFFEIEALEVLEVNIDPEKSSFPKKKDGTPDFEYIGSVRGRYEDSEFEKNIDATKNFKPIHMGTNQVPLVGEIVAGIEFFGQRFYISPINLYGNVYQNTKHGISVGLNEKANVSKKGYQTAQDSSGNRTGYYSNDLTEYKPILPFEGDTILNGRYGNSIRIGSNKEKDGNILLSVGQNFKKEDNFKLEEPDLDGSNIYITNHQLNNNLKFTPGRKSELVTELESYDGGQIYLGGDRIILNTKQKGDIYLSSNNNIAISSVNQVVLEDLKTQIGSVKADEPLVLGNVNEKALTSIKAILDLILEILGSGLAQTVPAQVPVVPNPAGTQKITQAITESGTLGGTIPNTKSVAHFTEKGKK